jgi:hypothetical protein
MSYLGEPMHALSLYAQYHWTRTRHTCARVAYLSWWVVTSMGNSASHDDIATVNDAPDFIGVS